MNALQRNSLSAYIVTGLTFFGGKVVLAQTDAPPTGTTRQVEKSRGSVVPDSREFPLVLAAPSREREAAASPAGTSVNRHPGPMIALAGELPDAPSQLVQTTGPTGSKHLNLAAGGIFAPTPALSGLVGQEQANPAQDTARISGAVFGPLGDGVPGAQIRLTSPGKMSHESKTTTSDDGRFSFADLPPGKFRLLIAAPGFGAYTSSELSVVSGQTLEVPKITLNAATSSSVNVFAGADEIAEAQIDGQEKQRVFGVFQNFYTSYIWDAEPMSSKQKYRLALRTIVDPTTFVVLAGVAGAEHYNGTYPGYGPGIGGYGKRYGAALADAVSGRLIGSAVLASAFHQDPRYFYQGSGGIGSRSWHALSSAVVTRSDSGKLQPNYAHLLGNLAAGAIANAYHPDSSRGLGLTFETLGVTTGANAIGNLFREFLLRSLEPSVPGFANGKKPSSSSSRHQ